MTAFTNTVGVTIPNPAAGWAAVAAFLAAAFCLGFAVVSERKVGRVVGVAASQRAYDATVSADVDAVAASISATYGGQVNPEVLHDKMANTSNRTRTGIGPMPVRLPAGVQDCTAVYHSAGADPTLLCGTNAVEPPHVGAA